MPTIKRYVDFAGKSGFEYMMIDEGWCLNSGHRWPCAGDADVTQAKADIDMPALVDYAKKKKVGPVVVGAVVAARPPDGRRARAVPRSGASRASRSTSWIATTSRWSTTTTSSCARPRSTSCWWTCTAPIRRPVSIAPILTTSPRKASWVRSTTSGAGASPRRHNVSLAYTRMLLGPVDYTPGGFRNATPADFEVVNSPPQVQTTRGHGLAMFVVYESPFQMVADSPDTMRMRRASTS